MICSPPPLAVRRLLLTLCVSAGGVLVETPRAQTFGVESALRATVFLRMIGDVSVTFDPQTMPAGYKPIHLADVEIATGSGVVVSPLGHILTCNHVVADGERTALLGRRRVQAIVKVRRIEVAFPNADAGVGPVAAQRYEASVVASSADLDLAVLSINGAGFATVDLGDSDVLEPGENLQAVGFPFGQDVEIGQPLAAEAIAPSASVSRADFSAFRTDAQGVRRYLQTSGAVNPGHSGGPLVDADGYVVGIVTRRLTAGGQGTGIGFALPINLVKEFLEASGLDGHLPARRMSLGPYQALEGKGLRARLPWGISDTSPFRARVDSGGPTSATPVLRIDRVVSTWDLARLTNALVAQQALEPFAASATAVQRNLLLAGRRAVIGHVGGTWLDGAPARMEFAVIDLGQEKILARYAGPASAIAYNASVFRTSLATIEADALRRQDGAALVASGWTRVAAGAVPSGLTGLPLPDGWTREPGSPLSCEGLPAPAEGLSASPPSDFTVSLRLGVIGRGALTLQRAAASCGQAIDETPNGYRRAISSFGTRLAVEGRFLQAGPDWLIQCETVGPLDQQAALRSLLAQWLAQLSR